MTTTKKFVLTTLAGAALMFGCLMTGAVSRPAAAAELKHVTLRLGFIYNAHRSAYLLGRDKGFYKDEGLDLDVLEGKGFTSTLQLVAAKQDTFAVVDPPSMMLGVAQGMPIKAVLQVYQRSPNALISWKDAHIKEPKDLVGKTVSTLQGDTTTTMLYALLARNHINSADVKIFAADGGTRNQTFLSRRSQAITGFPNDSFLTLKAAGAGDNITYFMYSDFGINTMGDNIVTHVDTIKSSPDVVRGFVKATIRAYEYALAHPEEAVDSLAKVAKVTDRNVEIEKIKATRLLVDSPDTKAHGFGYNSKAAWQAAETLMVEFGGLTKKAANVEDYYTNEFLPSK